MNNPVLTMTLLSSGSVAIGDMFTSAGGVPSPYLAFYSFDRMCPADLDCSDRLDVQDVFAFLNAWFTADPAADVDLSGTADMADLIAYINAWLLGC